MFDDDRYYTPEALASELVSDIVTKTPQTCVDSTCGTGNLLRAAQNKFEDVDCLGLDRDRRAISLLRRREPNWLLSVGDVLRPSSYRRTTVANSKFKCDLLLLNPPFSHNGRKYFQVEFDNQHVRASTAMAHILQALELFSPRIGGIVVVPESLLYSETDSAARALLRSKYTFRSVCELSASTFHGTRARAAVVQLTPQELTEEHTAVDVSRLEVSEIDLIRGSLPVHSAKKDERGVPYVHSTDIANPRVKPQSSSRMRVKSNNKGAVRGWAVLLPRVGVPKIESIVVRDVRDTVHLSDCVIALRTTSRDRAYVVRNLLRRYWGTFVDIYRGTGARYTTVTKLKAWLETRGVRVKVQ